MWWIFILHCLKKVLIFKPLWSLVPYSLSARVLLSVGKAGCICFCILHVGSQAIGKIEDHWIIQAGIPNPVWASFIPVYASCPSCVHHCDQSGSALWITLQRCQGCFGGGFSMVTSTLPSTQPCLLLAPTQCACREPCLHHSSPLLQPPGQGNRWSPPAGTVMLCCGCTVLPPLPLTANPMVTTMCLASFSVYLKMI